MWMGIVVFYWVLPVVTEFYWVLQGLIWVPLGLIGFHKALTGLTRFESSLIRFPMIFSGFFFVFYQFSWVLLSFTGFSSVVGPLDIAFSLDASQIDCIEPNVASISFVVVGSSFFHASRSSRCVPVWRWRRKRKIPAAFWFEANAIKGAPPLHQEKTRLESRRWHEGTKAALIRVESFKVINIVMVNQRWFGVMFTTHEPDFIRSKRFASLETDSSFSLKWIETGWFAKIKGKTSAWTIFWFEIVSLICKRVCPD